MYNNKIARNNNVKIWLLTIW